LGAGTAARFAEAPAGKSAPPGEPKGFPQREAEGLWPRPNRWKDQRLVVPRSAPLSPRSSRREKMADPFVFMKNEGVQEKIR